VDLDRWLMASFEQRLPILKHSYRDAQYVINHPVEVQIYPLNQTKIMDNVIRRHRIRRKDVAKFLDHHTMPPMTPEQRNAMVSQVKSMIGKPDSAGVIFLNVFMAPGEAWGYSEAPNAEAVVKSHEAMGIKIKTSDVVEVESII
jgi:hypothetical protein